MSTNIETFLSIIFHVANTFSRRLDSDERVLLTRKCVSYYNFPMLEYYKISALMLIPIIIVDNYREIELRATIGKFYCLQSRGAEIDQSMTRSVLESMKATMFKTDYFVLTVTLSLAKLQNEGKLSEEEVQSFVKDKIVRNSRINSFV